MYVMPQPQSTDYAILYIFVLIIAVTILLATIEYITRPTIEELED